MSLRVRSSTPDADGRVLSITPESAGWRYVGFEVRRLTAGQHVTLAPTGNETCVVVLTGTADVQVGELEFPRLGGRKTVFEDAPPGAVYAPAGSRIRIQAVTGVEVALCSAPAAGAEDARHAPRAIAGERMPQETRGEGTNRRFVRNVLPETEPAGRLLVVEVITPGGHWSSYPPHKHDVHNPPQEVDLEEIYYYRISRPEGYAIQRVYTKDRRLDATLTVRSGEMVLVPEGYHPVVAAHGYDVYYLNALAGSARSMAASDDPDYAWVRETWREQDPRLPLFRKEKTTSWMS